MACKNINKLNDRDLECIARHIRAYIKKGIIAKSNDDPCENCIHCMGEKVFNPFKSFKKLFDITGIDVNTFIE